MIYGHIHTSESAAAYSETIRKAIQILRETDVTDMHHGKYPLDGDRLILQINEVTTGPGREQSARRYTENTLMYSTWFTDMNILVFIRIRKPAW